MIESECVLWPGALTRGYGVFRRKGRNYYVHRVIYEAAYGPIPPGLLVRHTCDVRNCYNPLHLLVGTVADNSRDMVERGRHHLHGTTECKNGHPWSEENTRIDPASGARRCRECARRRAHEWRERRVSQ